MNINRIVHAGFWFGKTDVKDAIAAAKAGVGGFCIYFGNKKDVKELTETLQNAAPHQLLFSADYEYGLGRWLKDCETLPSNITLGAGQSEELAQRKGYLTAVQARELGIGWVLAPVLDLADTASNPIVNTRSFGKSPQLVSRLARAFIYGLQDGGCLNSIKHFPGHGATHSDSHLELPVINKTDAELQKAELIPFKELYMIADSVMAAHLKITAWDKDKPASFSTNILTDILRKNWHYKNCIVTDALVMKATGGLNPVDAFKAGADILLCPDDPLKLIDDLRAAIDKEPKYKEHAAEALSRQEFMINKLNSLKPIPCKDPFAKTTLAADAAAKCTAIKGEFKPFKQGQSVYYIEVENKASDLLAKHLLESLKNNGIKVLPYQGGAVDNLLAVTFSNYAAFSGQINFTDQQKQTLNDAFAKANNSILISFGSPFVDMGLDKLNAFIFAGTQTQDFQAFAAALLLGKEQAIGIMPV